MTDPFAIIAIVTSALIIPVLIFILTFTIRHVAIEHYDLVEAQYRLESPAQSHHLSSSQQQDSLPGGHNHSEYIIYPGEVLQSLASAQRDHAFNEDVKQSLLPETFDEIFDQNNLSTSIGANQSSRNRTSTQEMDLGLVPMSAREAV